MSLSVVAYGAALSISILLGAGPLPLKLRRAAIASVVGLVCLASVAVDRSLFLILVRRPTKIGGLSSMGGKQAVVRPRTAKTLTYLTLIVGVACLADAALQTALALMLSTEAFLIATRVTHVLAVFGIISGVALYLRFWR